MKKRRVKPPSTRDRLAGGEDGVKQVHQEGDEVLCQNHLGDGILHQAQLAVDEVRNQAQPTGDGA